MYWIRTRTLLNISKFRRNKGCDNGEVKALVRGDIRGGQQPGSSRSREPGKTLGVRLPPAKLEAGHYSLAQRNISLWEKTCKRQLEEQNKLFRCRGNIFIIKEKRADY